ncbi:MAG TPA: hypothetical protein DEF51_08800, partial [Myxococcales bacterium]|nr:hypothetical protein [Myxococcales bacterium]
MLPPPGGPDRADVRAPGRRAGRQPPPERPRHDRDRPARARRLVRRAGRLRPLPDGLRAGEPDGVWRRRPRARADGARERRRPTLLDGAGERPAPPGRGRDARPLPRPHDRAAPLPGLGTGARPTGRRHGRCLRRRRRGRRAPRPGARGQPHPGRRCEPRRRRERAGARARARARRRPAARAAVSEAALDALPVTTERAVLRLARDEDARRVADYQRRNRAHFARWDPRRPEGFFTDAFWHRRVAADAELSAQDRAYRLFVFSPDEATVRGHVHFANVVRGAFQCCHLGFGIDRGHEGRGLMRESLDAAIGWAFGPLRLHRIEANHRPDNLRSGGLLERL